MIKGSAIEDLMAPAAFEPSEYQKGYRDGYRDAACPRDLLREMETGLLAQKRVIEDLRNEMSKLANSVRNVRDVVRRKTQGSGKKKR